MRTRHFLLVAASFLTLSFGVPAWGRGGSRAAPARSAAPSAAPRVVERSSPPRYQPQQSLRSNSTATASPQIVNGRQFRSTYSGNDFRHFDRNGHQLIILPDWGYDGWPYYYGYDSAYPYGGAETTSGPAYPGVAANPQVTPNGPALFGQQPGPVGVSPELARANAELTDAEAALDAARQRALETLAGRPDYRAALAEKTAAEEQIDALHAAGESSYQKLLPAAQAALEARQQVTQIENAAMANDPQIAGARTRLEAAVANRSALLTQAG